MSAWPGDAIERIAATDDLHIAHRGPKGRDCRDHPTRSALTPPKSDENTLIKIAVLGTGMVGRILAARLAGLGHDVVIGTRDPAATLARTEGRRHGHPTVRTLAGRAP